MTDDLRTRIAAVVREHQQGQEWGIPTDECECGWSSRKNEIDYADHLAGAVIRELEAGYVLVPKSVTLVQWADEAFKGHTEGNFKHEHVGEWATDDR